MRDSYGREITYLRLSLTERCNLGCVYCRGGIPGGPTPRGAATVYGERSRGETPPGAGGPDAGRVNAGALGAGEPDGGPRAGGPDAGEPGGEWCEPRELRLDEIKRIIPCMIALGIRKIRLTGGEPLLRGDLEDIVAYLGTFREIQDLAMTTNGQGLDRRAAALKKAGLTRVNISLDSLKPGRYRELTGGGGLEETLAGIRAALAWGLGPVKLNCVVLRGRNDDEAGAFIALAREQPLHVRFIELMPFGERSAEKLRVVSAELLASHGELYELGPDTKGGPGGGVAAVYTGRGFRGTVGFISPMSRCFCPLCNRVRITADGKLKTCLGDNAELDLRNLLDGPDTVLRSAIEGEIVKKPRGHHFGEGFVSRRAMNRIGG